MAIDKEALVSRAYNGIGTPADAHQPVGRTRSGRRRSRRHSATTSTSTRRSSSSTPRGTRTRTETGSATCRWWQGHRPPLPRPLRTRIYSRPHAQFITAWLKEIGIGTKLSVFNDTQLTVEIGKGKYDIFVWGWTPFVDPDPELSYFTCSQVSTDAKDYANYYNDASWCDPVYDKLYKQQHVELDHAKRVAIVHQMLTRFYRSATYDILGYGADLQAYRTDRFTGWLHQPSNIGPVIFSNTSPTYANLKPKPKPAKSAVLPEDGRRHRGSLAPAGRHGVVRGGQAHTAQGRRPRRRVVERQTRRRQAPRLAGDACLRRRLQLLPLSRRRVQSRRHAVPRAATHRDAA